MDNVSKFTSEKIKRLLKAYPEDLSKNIQNQEKYLKLNYLKKYFLNGKILD